MNGTDVSAAAERPRRIARLVRAALRCPTGEREAFLDAACHDEPELRRKVDQEMREAAASSRSTGDVSGILASFELTEDDRVGPYRIVREIGRGGMAIVYLAERGPAERGPAERGPAERGPAERGPAERVAVKLALQGLPGRSWNRFRSEREILAGLEHPNIARLLDAGAMEDGRPYLVMEYLDGTAIDDYCDREELSLRARLELFCQVCDAVDAAHGRGVIHRDIKPSNILVTAEGAPKLLDFGIAKLLDPETAPFVVEATAENHRPLTPHYASPEQIRAEELTPLTDVYSLGALLYRLLTGHLPYEPERFTLRHVERAMAAGEAPRPSRVVAREGGLRELRRELSGGLDHVLRKALRHDPRHRYASPAAFAEDLRRHLDGESVQARREALLYWTGRFFARRRRLVAAALLAVLLLGAYLLGRRDRDPAARLEFAERDRVVLGDFRNLTGEELREESLELTFRIGLEQSSYVSVLPQSRVRDALRRMRRDPETAVDRETGREVCLREGAKALVVGSMTTSGARVRVVGEIVEPATGETLYRSSAEAEDPERVFSAFEEVTAEIRAAFGESLQEIEASPPLAEVTTSDLEALQAYSLAAAAITRGGWETALPLLVQAVERDPDFAMAHARLAVAYFNLGRAEDGSTKHLEAALRSSDRLTGVEKLYVEGWQVNRDGPPENALQHWSMMGQLYPDSAMAHYNLGMSYFVFFEDFGNAVENLENALRVDHGIRPSHARTYLASAYLALGDVGRAEATLAGGEAGHSPDLEALFQVHLAKEDLPQARAALARMPSASMGAIRVYGQVALAADQGKFQEALTRIEVPFREARAGNLASSTLSWTMAAAPLADLSGDEDALRQLLEVVLELAPRVLAERSSGFTFLPVPALAQLGKVAAGSSALAEAEEVAGLLRGVVEGSESPRWQSYLEILDCEILLARGKVVEARELCESALAHLETFEAHDSLARVYEAAGETERALAENRWLLAHRARAVARLDAVTVVQWNEALLRRGRLHEARGDVAAALADYQRLVERFKGGDRPPIYREAKLRLEALLSAGESEM